MLKQKAQQQRHHGHRRGPVVIAVVRVVPRPAAEGNAGPAAQPPEKPADEAEHMTQREHAQQGILRLQRELGRSVPGALAEAVIGEHDGLGLLGRAGGEEEELPRPAAHTAHQGALQLFAQLLIAPERVDVGVADQGLQKRLGRHRVEHDDLQPGETGREDLLHAGKAPVGEDADTAPAALLQFLRTPADVLIEFGKAPRLGAVSQRGRVRALLRPIREQMAKGFESHK